MAEDEEYIAVEFGLCGAAVEERTDEVVAVPAPVENGGLDMVAENVERLPGGLAV